MKKLLLTSAAVLAITASGAHATAHISSDMQSGGGWVEQILGDTTYNNAVVGAAINNLASVTEDHAKDIERIDGQLVATNAQANVATEAIWGTDGNQGILTGPGGKGRLNTVEDLVNTGYGTDGTQNIREETQNIWTNIKNIEEEKAKSDEYFQGQIDKTWDQATLATEKIWGTESNPHGIVNGPNGEGMLGDMSLIQSGTNNIKSVSRDSNYVSMTDAVLSLDNAIGDVSALQNREGNYGNGHNAHHNDVTTVVDALIATEDKIDSMIRQEGNLLHLGEHSVVIDQTTGDISHNGNGLSDVPLAMRTISQLDGQFHDIATVDYVDARLGTISNDIDNLTDELRTNLAATNAMSALVPNARSVGNTQISVGTGGYKDKIGVAAGLFHYVGDGTLLNAGVSYGTGHQAQIGWRAGVTFGF